MRYLFLIILTFLPLLLFAQEPMYTHYMYNTLSVNPAYAGSRDALTLAVLNRKQWSGFEGSPLTQTFTLHTPIINENIGLGLSVVNHKIGAINISRIRGDYAYKISLSGTSKLAFGLSAGFNVQQNSLSDLVLLESGDVDFSVDKNSGLLPNFGLGLYYSSKQYYVGISVPELLYNDFDADKTVRFRNHTFFLIGGGIFDLNPNFKLKPSTLVKIRRSAVQLDLSGILIYRSKLWGGLMYRTSDAFGALAGVFISPRLTVGYSFDMFSGKSAIRAGSHEIMLMYDLDFSDKGGVVSPRFF